MKYRAIRRRNPQCQLYSWCHRHKRYNRLNHKNLRIIWINDTFHQFTDTKRETNAIGEIFESLDGEKASIKWRCSATWPILFTDRTWCATTNDCNKCASFKLIYRWTVNEFHMNFHTSTSVQFHLSKIYQLLKHLFYTLNNLFSTSAEMDIQHFFSRLVFFFDQ